jgi:hypothetical protein
LLFHARLVCSLSMHGKNYLECPSNTTRSPYLFIRMSGQWSTSYGGRGLVENWRSANSFPPYIVSQLRQCVQTNWIRRVSRLYLSRNKNLLLMFTLWKKIRYNYFNCVYMYIIILQPNHTGRDQQTIDYFWMTQNPPSFQTNRIDRDITIADEGLQNLGPCSR